MIVRYCISCDTCGHHHTLRINVGGNPYQEHNFGCRHCGEPIKIGMNVDYENLSTQPVPVSNCVPSDQEGEIVTLHPELMVPDDLQGRDFAFPSLHEMFRIRQEDPTFNADIVNTSPSVEETLTGWERGDRTPPGVAHDWEFAKRVWSLFLRGEHDVYSNYIKREHANYRFDEPLHPYVVIYAFCARIGQKRAEEVFVGLQKEWEKAGTVNSKQRDALREYFLDNHALDFFSDTLTVISEYMAHFSEFSQVLIYQDRDVSVGPDSNPSSSAFDSTKMLYGNAFEHLTSFLTLPACLNNVVEARSYETFKELTLEKYLKLKKANRHRPFQNNTNLSQIADALNNQIRNASHHGRMQFNHQSGYVLYCPTIGGDVKEMKYVKYLMLCNSIVQTIAGLACFLIAELHPEKPKASM